MRFEILIGLFALTACSDQTNTGSTLHSDNIANAASEFILPGDAVFVGDNSGRGPPLPSIRRFVTYDGIVCDRVPGGLLCKREEECAKAITYKDFPLQPK